MQKSFRRLMKRFLPFIFIAAVALLTVGIATAVYRAKTRPTPSRRGRMPRERRRRPEETEDPFAARARSAQRARDAGDLRRFPVPLLRHGHGQRSTNWRSNTREIAESFP